MHSHMRVLEAGASDSLASIALNFMGPSLPLCEEITPPSSRVGCCVGAWTWGILPRTEQQAAR